MLVFSKWGGIRCQENYTDESVRLANILANLPQEREIEKNLESLDKSQIKLESRNISYDLKAKQFAYESIFHAAAECESKFLEPRPEHDRNKQQWKWGDGLIRQDRLDSGAHKSTKEKEAISSDGRQFAPNKKIEEAAIIEAESSSHSSNIQKFELPSVGLAND